MPSRAIQTALSRAGFDPGPVDGLWGVRSRTALRLFQVARGLLVDGLPGPASLAALGLDPACAREPAWMRVARGLLGTRERAGTGSEPAILDWAAGLGGETGRTYRDDAVPWCGLFVAHCLAIGLPDEPQPANPLWARAWSRFGLALAEPAPGAICVFSRPGGGGHVGFWAGVDRQRGAIRVLGGNQADAVSLAALAADRLLAVRWPASGPRPIAGPARSVAVAGALSENEA